jgi:hypothetical protein
MTLGSKVASVNNARKWQPGMTLYIDDEVFVVDLVDEIAGTLTFKVGSTATHATGTKLYETGCQKIYMMDILQDTYGVGLNYVYTHNPHQWTVGSQIKIEDEVMTISAIDAINKKITFTTTLTKPHGINAKVIPPDENIISHGVNDRVYKIATVLTGDAAQGATSITIANATMLNVGDRICIEGFTRTYNKETETTITAVNGNTLTLASGLVTAASSGFIVIKTSRDCVFTSTDLADVNRPFLYFTSGSSTYIGRKCVIRNVEFSHIGNGASAYYSGVYIRSDFSRWVQEREIRGCVIRDGWAVDAGGLNIGSAHWINSRNNVVVKCYNGIRLYDINGSSTFNNVTIGNISSSYRLEASDEGIISIS